MQDAKDNPIVVDLGLLCRQEGVQASMEFISEADAGRWVLEFATVSFGDPLLASAVAMLLLPQMPEGVQVSFHSALYGFQAWRRSTSHAYLLICPISCPVLTRNNLPSELAYYAQGFLTCCLYGITLHGPRLLSYP